MKETFDGRRFYTVKDLSDQSLINKQSLHGMIRTSGTIPAPVRRPETGQREYYDEATMAKLLAYFDTYRIVQLAKKLARAEAVRIIDEAMGKK